ncbi:transposase family protein [Streptomyces sp. NBC_01483]|uniref:transposase family protein n=1 Tax=Streptomyces sp. NBC_01483 TaxID=2903883 RepID=UPI002E313FB1|nr:transposase family protein [Streptomyces sp. NBC_01483]
MDCPGCGTAAHRVHSRYQRHLADTAVAGQPVVIDLSVRRLACDRPTCPRRTSLSRSRA